MNAVKLCAFNGLPQCYLSVLANEPPVEVIIQGAPPPVVLGAEMNIVLRLTSLKVDVKNVKLTAAYPSGLFPALSRATESKGDVFHEIKVADLTADQSTEVLLTDHYKKLEISLSVSYCHRDTNEPFFTAILVPIEVFQPFDEHCDRRLTKGGIFSNVKLTSNLPIATVIHKHCLSVTGVQCTSPLVPALELEASPITATSASSEWQIHPHDTLHLAWLFSQSGIPRASTPRLERSTSRRSLIEAADLLHASHQLAAVLEVHYALSTLPSLLLGVQIPIKFDIPELWYSSIWRDAECDQPSISRCRCSFVAGDMRHFHLTIRVQSQHAATLAASDSMTVLYELTDYHPFWVINGMTRAKLDNWAGTTEIEVEMIAVAVGQLPLPSVKVMVLDAQSSMHQLFVSNQSATSQVSVLASPIKASTFVDIANSSRIEAEA
jgi:hypothetical protein